MEKTIRNSVEKAVEAHYAHLLTKSKEELIEDAHHITDWFNISDWFLNQDADTCVVDETVEAFFASQNVVQELFDWFQSNYETPENDSIQERYEAILAEYRAQIIKKRI